MVPIFMQSVKPMLNPRRTTSPLVLLLVCAHAIASCKRTGSAICSEEKGIYRWTSPNMKKLIAAQVHKHRLCGRVCAERARRPQRRHLLRYRLQMVNSSSPADLRQPSRPRCQELATLLLRSQIPPVRSRYIMPNGLFIQLRERCR